MKKNIFQNKIKKIIFENRGMSYIEFSLMLMIVIGLISIFMQVYGMVSTKILVSDTARNLVRHVELAGGAVYPDSVKGMVSNVLDDASSELGSIKDIDPKSIQVYMNNPSNINNIVLVTKDNLSSLKYQIRTPIKLTLIAKYNFVRLNGLVNVSSTIGKIEISETYQGSSEKFFKELEYNPLFSTN